MLAFVSEWRYGANAMSSQAIVETVAFFKDARGLVIEPIPANWIQQQHNVHVVLTEPGGIRGNHRHKQGTEILVVLGPALVRFHEDEGMRDVRVPENQVCRFTFPPGTAHAIQNTGTRPQLLIVFNTMSHDPDHADVVPEVLLEK